MGCRRAVLALGVVSLAISLDPRGAAAQRAGALEARVVHVDDGDTIDVRIGDRVERVRYIGIDAPEIAHARRGGRPPRAGAPGGARATRANAALVTGRIVRLELDVERRDRYGRLLAYVWVGPTMINAELVARGYARALPIPPNLRHARWIDALERDARAASRGLWGAPTLVPTRDACCGVQRPLAAPRRPSRPG